MGGFFAALDGAAVAFHPPDVNASLDASVCLLYCIKHALLAPCMDVRLDKCCLLNGRVGRPPLFDSRHVDDTGAVRPAP